MVEKMSDSIGVFVPGTRASKGERSFPVEFGFERLKSENSVTRTTVSSTTCLTYT